MLNRDNVLEMIREAFNAERQWAGACPPGENALRQELSGMRHQLVHSIVADWFLHMPKEGQRALAETLKPLRANLGRTEMALSAVVGIAEQQADWP